MRQAAMRPLTTLVVFLLITSCSDAADEAKTGADVLAMSEKDQTALVMAFSEELSGTVGEEAQGCISEFVENPKFTKGMLTLFERRAEQSPRGSLEAYFRAKCPTYRADRLAYIEKEQKRTAKVLEEARKREEDAKEKLDDIRERAVRLPDGRAVFPSKDGNWYFEDGSVVPAEDLRKLRNSGSR